MRNVSDEYKEAVKAKEIHTRIEGKLTAGSRVYDIYNKNIMPGSLSIYKKAINRSSFEYGAVVTSETHITLIMPDADRYTMYGAKLELTLYTLLKDGSEEPLKLGVWNVSECTKSKKYLAIKSYDNMLLFDKDITDDTVGSVHDVLVFACEKCGVEMSQTEEEILSLPNGYMQIRVRSDEIGTYRDLIYYIACITCTFAKIDENGKLILQAFGKKPVDELIKRQVQSSSISDFQSLYSGVKSRFIADTNYAPYEVEDSGTSGLILDMGDIPIVRGLPETKYEVLNNIMEDLRQIIYTPVDISIIGDPSIEPGDMLLVKNANLTEDDVTTLVTSTSWNFHSEMKIVSAGSNPKLATAKDKSSKQIESLESTVAAKDVVILSYTNAEGYKIEKDFVEIVDMSYVTFEGCKPIFLMMVQFSLDLDGVVEFALYNGLVAIPHATYRSYYEAGDHFETIFYLDSSDSDERKNIRVLARAYQQEGSLIRQQEADIKTLQNAIDAIKKTSDLSKLSYTTAVPDDTDPVLTIAAQEIRAIIYAQGISTRTEWDGDLEFTDHMGLIPLNSAKIGKFIDKVNTWLNNPAPATAMDQMGLIALVSPSVLDFTEKFGENEVIKNYIVDTSKAEYYIYDSRYVQTDEAYSLIMEYSYSGSYEENIVSVTIDNTEFADVEEVIVE